jgi:hypothetical protein
MVHVPIYKTIIVARGIVCPEWPGQIMCSSLGLRMARWDLMKIRGGIPQETKRRG